MRRFLPGCAVLGGLLAISACGGNVIVDNGAGAGGAGGSGGFGGSNVLPLCEQFCADVSDFGCGAGSTCVDDCNDLFAQTPSQCDDELAAYISCYDEKLPQFGCDAANACSDVVSAFADCMSNGAGGAGGGPGGCGMADCFGSSDGSCGCKGECFGQIRAVECSPQNGAITCQCSLDGSFLGTCSDSSGSCDLEASCCSVYFDQGF